MGNKGGRLRNGSPGRGDSAGASQFTVEERSLLKEGFDTLCRGGSKCEGTSFEVILFYCNSARPKLAVSRTIVPFLKNLSNFPLTGREVLTPLSHFLIYVIS
jgi:hypothetical protein